HLKRSIRRALTIKQMTRCVVGRNIFVNARAPTDAGRFELLTDVTHTLAKLARTLSILRIVCQQMSVRDEHRAAPASIGDDVSGYLIIESVNVAPRKLACAIEIARMSMKRAAADLLVGSTHRTTVHFKHALRRTIDASKESFRHATFEKQ